MIKIQETKIVNDPQKVSAGKAVFHVEVPFVVPRAENQSEVEEKAKSKAIEQVKEEVVAAVAKELSKSSGLYIVKEVADINKPVVLLPQRYTLEKLSKLIAAKSGGEETESGNSAIGRT